MISCKWRPHPLTCKPPSEWPLLVPANRLLKQRVPPTQRVDFQRIPCWVGAAQLSSRPAWKSHRVTEKHLLSSCLSASLAVKWYVSRLMLINFLIWECTLHFVLPVYFNPGHTWWLLVSFKNVHLSPIRAPYISLCLYLFKFWFNLSRAATALNTSPPPQARLNPWRIKSYHSHTKFALSSNLLIFFNF